MTESLMSTYNRLPVTFTYGKGCWLWDINNERYLDSISGIGVCNLGHTHPVITEAICRQTRKLMHTSNLYNIRKQIFLSEKLNSISGMQRSFFCNSGAEANEAAIKLARLYGYSIGIKTPTIIVMKNSFHGRTLATLTATDNCKKGQTGFEPLVNGFIRVPYQDINAIHNSIISSSVRSRIIAILVEPIQCEGGVNIPPTGYLKSIRNICDENNYLMIVDEVQTGIGRTGKFFAYQYEDIIPDIVTVAKALGNGMPIGACLAKGKVANLFTPGSHGSTFGGNPLACAAALAVIETIKKESILDLAVELGNRIVTLFNKQLAGQCGVLEIRHIGGLIGIQLDRPCSKLVKEALKKNLLINVTAENVIRLLPPLNMDNSEIMFLVDNLSILIQEFLSLR